MIQTRNQCSSLVVSGGDTRVLNSYLCVSELYVLCRCHLVRRFNIEHNKVALRKCSDCGHEVVRLCDCVCVRMTEVVCACNTASAATTTTDSIHHGPAAIKAGEGEYSVRTTNPNSCLAHPLRSATSCASQVHCESSAHRDMTHCICMLLSHAKAAHASHLPVRFELRIDVRRALSRLSNRKAHTSRLDSRPVHSPLVVRHVRPCPHRPNTQPARSVRGTR